MGRKTLTQFIADNKITMTAEWTDSNPNMPDFRGDHWKCVLKHNKRRMTLVFSQGYGHNGTTPTIDTVLSCLASDVPSSDSFEDWCGDLGYDTDSRKAERIYKAVTRQTDKLKQLLGDSLFEELVYETDKD